jgi:hypothetical protein
VRIVGVVKMVAWIVRAEAEVAVRWGGGLELGAWSLKLIVVKLGRGVAPAGCSHIDSKGEGRKAQSVMMYSFDLLFIYLSEGGVVRSCGVF